MSIDMYVGKSKSQSSDVESTAKSISSGYDSLQKGIMQFVSAGELQGQAYDSGKQFFSAVIAPLTESIKTLGELTEQACNDFVDQYQSEVDSQSLKESELLEDIEELKKQISQLEVMNASLKHKSSKNSSLLSGNHQMISSLEQQKKELEEKLRKLRQFDAKSPNIFKEVESFQKTVQQGINQAKTAWDPGKQAFNIPAGKNMEWAKVSQQKALEVRMDKINQKAKDGKKLSKNDLHIVMGYAQSHPKEDVPKNLKEYMIQNKDSITRDLGLDIASSGVEQVGFNMQKFAGVLNTYGGFKGPNGKNSFVQVTNKSGNQMIKHGRLVSNIGKAVGYTTMGVGFGFGMYDDIANNNKTAGEATVHNGFTTSSGILGGAVMAIGTGTLVASNPFGWGAVAAVVGGTAASVFSDWLYNQNPFGIKDKGEWVGRNVIDPTLEIMRDSHTIHKGIVTPVPNNFALKHQKRIIKYTKSNIENVNNNINSIKKDAKQTAKQISNEIENEKRKVTKEVGQAVNKVKK